MKKSVNNNRLTVHFTGSKAAVLTTGICLSASTAWAGPYYGGQFGLYALFVFMYLALPAVAILAVTKTVFWSRLKLASGRELYPVFLLVASTALACLEFAVALAITAGLYALAQLIPVIAEVDRYSIWVALIGWSMFFIILGLVDVRNSLWLLRRAQNRFPDKTLPQKGALLGAISLWVALVLMVIVVTIASYFGYKMFY
ncbi:MAG: hypothetical protein CVV41_16385 [Candidatus Riflebacteria bacterium HGW-Riflebacteria-1]|jgi:uncharacterized membrane protein YidH (DUF202 family)|nr:MAG: hypothetical protein CVV41_16385 [Candidatus Riflebacteria bacterium HGW-Riflebacteria-1]